MGSSSVHFGFANAIVTNDDGSIALQRKNLANTVHQSTADRLFEVFVRTGTWVPFEMASSLGFRRHGPKRPYLANRRQIALDRQNNVSNLGSMTRLQGTGPNGSSIRHYTTESGGISGNTALSTATAMHQKSRVMGTSAQSTAIGSLSMIRDMAVHGLARGVGLIGAYTYEAACSSDILGTVIGNVFRHPVGRDAWFNEVGVVAFSQGQIVIEGVFSPPVEQLAHYGYQIYHTRSGGTGVIQGAVKTTGSTASGTPSRFTDSVFAGFVLGDVGKYIAIHGRGIYLITGFVDASNVDTDAVAINEGFTTQSGLTWTLRTGPIGEYFWRRRPYMMGDTWTNAPSKARDLRLDASDEDVSVDSSDFKAHSPAVYDGHGHWWWTRETTTASATRASIYGLCRWLHHSPQPMQSLVSDGTMDFGADWLGGTFGSFLGVERDINRKLWIHGTANGGPATGYVLARVEPCPGGDATTPVIETRWRKQQSAADATGLTGKNVAALCVDTSGVYSGGGGTQRIWAIADAADDTSSGISYSDDSGTTWKRLHLLAAQTGTVTATNGSAAVLGVGTLFTTQFAVGDWIRFGSDTRSYEIMGIADALNMTLASAYQGTTGGGKSIQKGALASNEATAYSVFNFPAGGDAQNTNKSSLSYASIDWDTNGNVYWISNSSPRRVCRWNQSTGAVVSFAETAIAAVTNLTAMASGSIGCLRVSRVPSAAGAGTHPFHNDIWIGCNLSQSTSAGGWVRVIGSTFSASPSGANFTRYHPNTVDSFPASVRAKPQVSATVAPNSSVIMNRDTGAIVLLSPYNNGDTGGQWMAVAMSGTDYWDVNETSLESDGFTASTQAGRTAVNRTAFDNYGIGIACLTSDKLNSSTFTTDNAAPIVLTSSVWNDRRWNGSQWVIGMMTSRPAPNLNVASGGLSVFVGSTALGAGVRRMSEWATAFDHGMSIRFLQAGGAVAQSDEFIIDETSTFVAYLGTGKDNTQTIDMSYDMSMVPTVRRMNTEPVRLARNLWTIDGGVEGGWNSSNSQSTTNFLPPYTRGIASLDNGQVGPATTSGPYPDTRSPWTISSTNCVQAFIQQRIADEVIVTVGDGSISTGSDLFTVTTPVFTAGDVGKSIFVEGVNGATPDINNGQAVVTEYIGTTQVRVLKTFNTTASSLKWRMKNIPPVGFVSVNFYSLRVDALTAGYTTVLWSSSDLGETWTEVKRRIRSADVPTNGPDTGSDGIYISRIIGSQGRLAASFAEGDELVSSSVLFDLRSLPVDTRRRQMWRVGVFNTANAPNTSNWEFGGIVMYDENMTIMCRPLTNKISDADDDQYFANTLVSSGYIMASGSQATPADNGDILTGLTDTVNTSEGLYLATGVDNAALASGGVFTAPSAIFTRLSVGRFIRISGAVNSSNHGMALITGYISSTQVQLSRNYAAETNTFDWQMLEFGAGDKLRLVSSVSPVHVGEEISNIEYVISDVPSNTQIKVSSASIPSPLTGSPVAWEVSRDPVNMTVFSLGLSYPLDTDSAVCINGVNGTISHSFNLEFVVVQTSTVGATTPADDDGDDRTDVVIVGEALTAVDGPVAGDLLEMTHATYGTRVMEIMAITGSDPNKNIRVKYDEVQVGLTGVTWRILRRRDLDFAVRNILVHGDGVQL